MLTSVSFFVFGMSHEVGERLGFGITLILAIEVSKTVFQHMIPVCGELLWLELFSALNLIFCVISLAESCLVLFLAHHDEPTLLPPWIVELLWGCTPSMLKRAFRGPQKIQPHQSAVGMDIDKSQTAKWTR